MGMVWVEWFWARDWNQSKPELRQDKEADVTTSDQLNLS